jgi:hypothetical protein
MKPGFVAWQLCAVNSKKKKKKKKFNIYIHAVYNSFQTGCGSALKMRE